MSESCKCGQGIPQLFVEGCKGLVDITDRIIAFPKMNNIPARNSLFFSALPITALIIQGKFKAGNNTARWHITPSVMNPTWTPNENTVQTFDGGETVKLADGTHVMSFIVTNVNPQEAAKFKALECGNNDIMIVTQSGQLMAYASQSDIAAGFLYGLPVQNISVLATPMKTNQAVSQVQVTITFSKTMKLSNIVTVEPADILVDLTTLLEPKNVNFTVSGAPTTTAVTVVATADYYGISGAQPIVGLQLADFIILNLPSTPVTPLTVTESPAGTYAITYAAQSSLDDMFLRIASNTTANLVSSGVNYQIP